MSNNDSYLESQTENQNLQKQFENGDISEDKLIEGQKEMISNLIENAE